VNTSSNCGTQWILHCSGLSPLQGEPIKTRFFLMGSVHINRKRKDSWLGWNHTTSSGTRWLVEIIRVAFMTIPHKTRHSEMFCLVWSLIRWRKPAFEGFPSKQSLEIFWQISRHSFFFCPHFTFAKILA
jgi:hypothetical protein